MGKATMLLQALQLDDSPMELTLDGILVADDFENVKRGRWNTRLAAVRDSYFLHQRNFQDAKRFEFDG